MTDWTDIRGEEIVRSRAARCIRKRDVPAPVLLL